MLLRAVVNLATRSNLPEDQVQNTWHFSVLDSQDPVTHGQIVDALRTFYGAIDGYLGRTVKNDPGAHTIRQYDVIEGAAGPEDDLTGSPVSQATFQTAGIDYGTVNLPGEMAVCLSLEGDVTDLQEELGNTRPASRRRGRLFIGPLSVLTVAEESGTQRPYVGAGFRTALLDAAEALHDEINTYQHDWVIYSRTNGASYPVYRCWVDDAFDVQRRRGEAPKQRDLRVLIP